MFGAKYSRLAFWIWSIILLIPLSVFGTFFMATEMSADSTNLNLFFNCLVSIIGIIWMNALANRIRDYGSNPWLALWTLVPLVNVGMAFYYGIARCRTDSKVDANSNNSNPSLTKAVVNHAREIISDIKPAVNEYIEKHNPSEENKITITQAVYRAKETPKQDSEGITNGFKVIVWIIIIGAVIIIIVSNLSEGVTAKEASTAKETSPAVKEIDINPTTEIFYKQYCDQKYGFCVDFPSSLSMSSPVDYDDGRTFLNQNSTFNMSVYGSDNTLGKTVEERKIQDYENDFDEITYRKNGKDWFALSGYKNNKILYYKVWINSECSNTLRFIYDKNKEYDVMVGIIVKSFKSNLNYNASHR